MVSVPNQQMDVIRGDSVIASYAVSTSRFGLGSEEGSFRTPLGQFRICEKIGDAEPVGRVFRGRRPQAEIAPQGGEEDLVLTRILWLDGCDAVNANTRERYIYIHGTNQEESIGSPASHGCIRMRAEDLLAIYEVAPVGASVEIVS